MKFCLIVPDRPYLLNQKALPSLGVLTVSSALKKHGCEVEVLDFADGWKYEEADLYGIACTTPDFPKGVQIMRWLKEKSPEAEVAVGGPHPTLMAEECFEAGFDAVCVGDAEETVPKLLKGERGIVEGWTRNIDAYHPDREALDLWQYNFRIDDVRATSLMTARGCIWGKCAFCSRFDKAVRYHSLGYVLEEVAEIARLGFKAVAIYDDEFFTHPKRDKEIIDVLNACDMVWRCFGKSDIVLRNNEIVKLAARKGLKEVLLGVESGDDETLSKINKGVTVEENKKAIKLLHGLGVSVKAAMIVGLPGESEETLKNTERFCEDVAPYVNDWDFTILQIYPGSTIWNNPGKYDLRWTYSRQAYKGMHTEGWDPSPISTSNLSFEDIMSARESLEKRFKG